MEPITHALTSLTLARASFNKASRLATPMLIASGLAADLDWLSVAGGPRMFLHVHRTFLHSLVGTAVIAVGVAAVFWWFGRRHPTAPVRFGRALAVCAVGAGAHLLLDMTNSYGVKLLWPFKQKWYAWDLTDSIDPWLLLLLLFGLLLPGLFRLISEEVGARPKARGSQHGAIVALALIALYVISRWGLHDGALEMLRARLYRGQTPLAVGAFPSGASPFTWAGVVETDNVVAELEVSFAPGSAFDPDMAHIYFKPEISPALESARNAEVAQEFLRFARFPRATVEKTENGYRVTLRDVRFSSFLPTRRGYEAVVDVNDQFQVTREELRFGSRGRR